MAKYASNEFTFDELTGTVEGPAGYINSDRYLSTKEEVTFGTHTMFRGVRIGTPIGQTIVNILDVDYKNWRREGEAFGWA